VDRLHNRNIDRTLDRLGTYVDPRTRMTLLKFLIAEENKLGDGRSQLKRTERRIRAHEGRIERMLAVIERLRDHGSINIKTRPAVENTERVQPTKKQA